MSMTEGFNLMTFNWEELIAMPTLENVNGQELKVKEDAMRVWLIDDNEVHVEIRINNEPGWSEPIVVLRAS